jgi:hypothetical protein
MLRLELEAQVANLQAEAGAMAAEAAVESGMPIDLAPAEPEMAAAPAVDAAPANDAAASSDVAPATDHDTASDNPTA